MCFSIRAYGAGDAEAVAIFFASAHRADPEVQFVPLAAWRAFVAYPTNRGGRDFAVAEADGGVVGLLASTLIPGRRRGRRRRHFRIVVHPLHRGRGIGTALLRRVEGQRNPGPRPVLQTLVPGTWVPALRFLRRRGFRVVERDLEMEREDAAAAAPDPPPGVSIRPFGRRGDFDAWIRLHAEGYRGEFHFEPLTRAAVRAELSGPGAIVLVAEERGRPVGVVLAGDHGADGGTVRSLLAARRRRRRGIGRALLRAALRALRERGRGRTSLGVAAWNRAAIRLYASEGFRRVREDLTLWR